MQVTMLVQVMMQTMNGGGVMIVTFTSIITYTIFVHVHHENNIIDLLHFNFKM
jgi:hypothetical protein